MTTALGNYVTVDNEPSSRKSSEETRQIGRVFFESPGTRSNGG
ncbi:hypothetical protein QFZ55_000067 [Streptomyces luteogriseus]|nr:hypothetical protein [Streptomyces luteogriseus]